MRDFSKVLDHPKVLGELVKDSTMTVEEAVNLLQESDLMAELPALKKIGQLATTLLGLNEEQLKKLSHDEKIVRNIKRLKNACQGILSKFGADGP